MAMDQTSIRRIKRRLLAFVQQEQFQKGWRIIISSKLLSVPDIYGEVDWRVNLMVLNPCKKKGSLDEFISTFVHECLHSMYRCKAERSIKQLEKRVFADLAPCEKMMLFEAIAQNAQWDE